MRVAVEYRMSGKTNWEKYCQENPEHLTDYVTFQNIIYTFNYSFRDYILETGEKGKLPWGIGDFAVEKYKRKAFKTLADGREVIGLHIDWKKTRASGKYIYHMNRATGGYNFRWKWFVSSARFRYSEVWVFKPSRISSRILRHYLTLPDYQYAYKQWKLARI